MKKAIVISLLTLILISQAGYYIIYNIQQSQLKNQFRVQMMSGIPSDALIRMDVGNLGPEIKWEENGREFYLDGNLYDLVYSKSENGKTILFSLADHQETQLINDFARILKISMDGDPASKNGKQEIIKFHVSDYIFESNVKDDFHQRTENNQFIHPDENELTISTDVLAPPPRV